MATAIAPAPSSPGRRPTLPQELVTAIMYYVPDEELANVCRAHVVFHNICAKRFYEHVVISSRNGANNSKEEADSIFVMENLLYNKCLRPLVRSLIIQRYPGSGDEWSFDDVSYDSMTMRLKSCNYLSSFDQHLVNMTVFAEVLDSPTFPQLLDALMLVTFPNMRSVRCSNECLTTDLDQEWFYMMLDRNPQITDVDILGDRDVALSRAFGTPPMLYPIGLERLTSLRVNAVHLPRMIGFVLCPKEGNGEIGEVMQLVGGTKSVEKIEIGWPGEFIQFGHQGKEERVRCRDALGALSVTSEATLRDLTISVMNGEQDLEIVHWVTSWFPLLERFVLRHPPCAVSKQPKDVVSFLEIIVNVRELPHLQYFAYCENELLADDVTRSQYHQWRGVVNAIVAHIPTIREIWIYGFHWVAPT
ncbi:hypothetical protein AMATHDRAFT_1398 [Amanita thiersii Skay4041]|uniref:F-box domain-containing protein n=1 Tax=Amanita thiersii Skay4041 TaxID=703135 RepID=A0A2A9NVE0_9AGAR|nr:hypothetical protein AMATHDRAFT_1398 [Amanita thiersii Skay4041]